MKEMLCMKYLYQSSLKSSRTHVVKVFSLLLSACQKPTIYSFRCLYCVRSMNMCAKALNFG